MKRRLLDSFGVAMALAAVVVVFPLAAVPALGQTTGTTAWGHPDLGGIWLDVYDTPLERAPELGDREFATAEERAARDAARRTPGRNIRGPRGSAQDVSGAYNAVFSSAKPAGPRTSLVVDPPNGRIPALTPEGRRAEEIRRDWRVMLMRNTPTCEQQAPGCEGGPYGPVSPRRFDVPPFYNTLRMNRHDGPEDQSLGDRCMLGATPDLNGFRRIVQGEDSVAIAYDTGQGQGYQRIVNLGGSKRRHGVEIRPTRVLELLVDDPRLPRSLCRAIDAAADTLDGVALGPGPSGAARRCAADLAATVHQPWTDAPSLDERAGRLRRMDGECRGLHDLVMAAHVGYDADGAPVR